jgi:hypothetical protein
MKEINEMCIFANLGKNWGMEGNDCALFIYTKDF